jgi:hypothetical protein
MFKKVSKRIYRSTVVVSPDPLSPTIPTYSAMNISENTEEHADDLEPAHEGDTQMEYSFD